MNTKNKAVQPTPAELCLLAKEIFGASDLMAGNEKTDAVLERALLLWVRAEQFARRAPAEVRRLDEGRRKAASDYAHQTSGDEAKLHERLTIDEAAKKHLGQKSGRRLRATLKELAADPKKGWGSATKILSDGTMSGMEAELAAELHRTRDRRKQVKK